MFGVVENCFFRISHQYYNTCPTSYWSNISKTDVRPPFWICFCVQFGEKTVPQIAIASHFIILIFHHQNCEKMGSTHVNPSSLPKTMPGGVKAEDPKSCVGATEIRKKIRAKQQWPSRDSAVDWNPESNHWARNPPDLELSSWDWGRGMTWLVISARFPLPLQFSILFLP